jgi:ABC-type oligopeptide transport system substrate-binding subunit
MISIGTMPPRTSMASNIMRSPIRRRSCAPIAPLLAVYYPGFNLTKPPFAKSRALRLALSMVIDAARALLRTSGDAAPRQIELRYNSSELHNRIALAVASMWKESLGIETRLHAEDYKVLMQDVDRADTTQVFRASWVGDYDDAFSFSQLLQSGFGINLPRCQMRRNAIVSRTSFTPKLDQRSLSACQNVPQAMGRLRAEEGQ